MSEQYRDYRVHVEVHFCVDVGARDVFHALEVAETITASVFRADFSRAENVSIDAITARPDPPADGRR